MKVLLINGSPRQNGNTATALAEVAKQLTQEGIDSEIVWIGTNLSEVVSHVDNVRPKV